MRNEYARVFSAWLKWAMNNKQESGYPETREFQQRRLGYTT
jgi:hypothetical protein